MPARALISPPLLSVCFVEKIVDFFRESGEEIQNFPLAKGRSFLIENVTSYLSITIRRVHSSVGRLPPAPATTATCRGYPQNGVNIL
jgi:hypothetical protein